MFGGIKNFLGKKSDGLKRFAKREMLEAVCAATAMIAYADGDVSPEEKMKVIGLIQRSEQLKVFDIHMAIELFNKYCDNLEFDVTVGRMEAKKVIGKLAHNSEEAQMCAAFCMSVANADGVFSKEERTVFNEICATLKVSPNNIS